MLPSKSPSTPISLSSKLSESSADERWRDIYYDEELYVWRMRRRHYQWIILGSIFILFIQFCPGIKGLLLKHDTPSNIVYSCCIWASQLIPIPVGLYRFTKGYMFECLQPESSSRDDQFSCLKANLQAWIQGFLKTKPIEEKLLILDLQRALACYMADPDIHDAAPYTLVYVFMFTLAHTVAGICIALFCNLALGLTSIVIDILNEPPCSQELSLLPCSGAITVVCCLALFCKSWDIYNMGAFHGRSLRLRPLVARIRMGCFEVDEEKPTTGDTKENLKWWIEELLRYPFLPRDLYPLLCKEEIFSDKDCLHVREPSRSFDLGQMSPSQLSLNGLRDDKNHRGKKMAEKPWILCEEYKRLGEFLTERIRI